MNEVLNVSSIEEPYENYTCSICLEENIEEEVVSTTNCSHSFCNKCLEDWLNNGKYSCPLCRNKIKSFITNNIETRILPVLIRSDMPTINNIPVSTIIHTLAYYNVRLRRGLYLSLATLVIVGNYYIHNSYDYSDLLDRYNKCTTNLTTYMDIYNEQVSVTLYKTDYNSLRICNIPHYYYNKCFH